MNALSAISWDNQLFGFGAATSTVSATTSPTLAGPRTIAQRATSPLAPVTASVTSPAKVVVGAMAAAAPSAPATTRRVTTTIEGKAVTYDPTNGNIYAINGVAATRGKVVRYPGMLGIETGAGHSNTWIIRSTPPAKTIVRSGLIPTTVAVPTVLNRAASVQTILPGTRTPVLTSTLVGTYVSAPTVTTRSVSATTAKVYTNTTATVGTTVVKAIIATGNVVVVHKNTLWNSGEAAYYAKAFQATSYGPISSDGQTYQFIIPTAAGAQSLLNALKTQGAFVALIRTSAMPYVAVTSRQTDTGVSPVSASVLRSASVSATPAPTLIQKITDGTSTYRLQAVTGTMTPTGQQIVSPPRALTSTITATGLQIVSTPTVYNATLSMTFASTSAPVFTSTPTPTFGQTIFNVVSSVQPTTVSASVIDATTGGGYTAGAASVPAGFTDAYTDTTTDTAAEGTSSGGGGTGLLALGLAAWYLLSD